MATQGGTGSILLDRQKVWIIEKWKVNFMVIQWSKNYHILPLTVLINIEFNLKNNVFVRNQKWTWQGISICTIGDNRWTLCIINWKR